MIKSSRYVEIARRAKYYTVNISQRFHNEAHVWSLLHDGDVGVVPLVGVYSIEAHPFGLVYEYMNGLDLKQRLRNDPTTRGLKLVLVPTHALSLPDVNPLIHLDGS